VEFNFAALDFRDPDMNQYAFRLEGFDSEWISAGDRHWASYTNLPGGNYVFRVKASNNDGLWNEDGLRLRLSVGFAPLTSPLALAVYGALIAIASGFASTRVARKALESTRAELARTKSGFEELGTELEEIEAFDRLTGTLDRKGLDERLERNFAAARRKRESVAVLIVDVDHFTAFNDSLGRQAGDDCLRRIAACLRASLERSGDAITRYGGAKFLVFVAKADIEAALVVGERLRRSVEALAIPRGNDRHGSVVTVSIGCAALRPELGLSSAVLLTAADRALYQAKERGRNTVAS
jgi:diguanylate cyclase (GGDEF)-like protein